MEKVLAKPTDLCCIQGGAIHTGEATGTVEQIEGVDTYIARPPPEKANGNVLLFFPDAFGMHLKSFLMMDAFAQHGYLTLGVDYFLGVKLLVYFYFYFYCPALPLFCSFTLVTGWETQRVGWRRKTLVDAVGRSNV